VKIHSESEASQGNCVTGYALHSIALAILKKKEMQKPVAEYTYPQLQNPKATIRPGSLLNRQGGSRFNQPEHAKSVKGEMIGHAQIVTVVV